jgi:hypothetical protein
MSPFNAEKLHGFQEGRGRYVLSINKDLGRRKGRIFVRDLMTSLCFFLSDCGFRDRVRKTCDETALLFAGVENEDEMVYALELSQDVYGDRLVS